MHNKVPMSSNGISHSKYAMDTIPNILKVASSQIRGAGYGVWTKGMIPQGIRFGPYGGVKVSRPCKRGYCWEIKRQKKIIHYIDAYDPAKSNWMRYVNCARNEEEQNLVAFQFKGEIYYRTTHAIGPDVELLVWYGDDYGKELGIDVPGYHKTLQRSSRAGKDPRCLAPPKDKVNPINNDLHVIDDCQGQDGAGKAGGQDGTGKYGGLDGVGKAGGQVHDGAGNLRHTCSICNKLFTGYELFRSHVMGVHLGKGRQFRCDACSRAFECKSDLHEHVKSVHTVNVLENHMPLHTGLWRFKCAICLKGFAQKMELKRHMMTHTGEKSHKCNICPKTFALNSNLKTHMLTHTGEKPHKCNICPKTFALNSNLKTHMLTHTGEKPFKCNICPKTYAQNSHLKTHMLTHTGEKPFKCNICPKTFAWNSHLKTHMLTHTGEKPFKCNICPKTFALNSNLKTHMLTHTGEKPHKCNICPKTFALNSNLKTHMLTHTGEKPFKCNICPKTYAQNSHLKTHMLTHTGEKPFKCNICPKTYAQNSHLKTHMLTHTGEKPFKCNICPKTFAWNSHLKTHMLTHTGEKPFKCNVCPKTFALNSNLKRHMLTHTGEKPHQCNICPKTFAWNSHLKSHMLTHTGEKPFKCVICSKESQVVEFLAYKFDDEGNTSSTEFIRGSCRCHDTVYQKRGRGAEITHQCDGFAASDQGGTMPRKTLVKLQQAYGDGVLSEEPRFCRWFEAFSEGKESIEDQPPSLINHSKGTHFGGTVEENIETPITDQLESIPAVSEFQHSYEEWKSTVSSAGLSCFYDNYIHINEGCHDSTFHFCTLACGHCIEQNDEQTDVHDEYKN
ncbi:zinc finger protein 665-like [Hetaerina americana]|uniref:zinc finger protein 665-like n=1 Tax=Hetaerina americana TaxID=62018 RepID=UPI003A7F4799